MEEWIFISPHSTILESVNSPESFYVTFAFYFINSFYLSSRTVLEVKSFVVSSSFYLR